MRKRIFSIIMIVSFLISTSVIAIATDYDDPLNPYTIAPTSPDITTMNL